MVTRADIEDLRRLNVSPAVINNLLARISGEEGIDPYPNLLNGNTRGGIASLYEGDPEISGPAFIPKTPNGTLQFPPMADPGTAMDVDTLLGNLGGPQVALNLPQPGSQASTPVNVSSDLVLVNGQWQVKDPGALPPPGGSKDRQILDNVMTGAVIDTSRLAEMTDPQMRRLAANQLAKNIVANFGATDPNTLTRIEDIYNQFVADLVDIDFKGWSEWVIGDRAPKTIDVTGITTVYFPDGTAKDVPTSELEAFLDKNPTASLDPQGESTFGADGERKEIPTAGLGADGLGTGSLGAGPQQGLIDFISSYASQTNDWTTALNAASNYALTNQDRVAYKEWAIANDVPEFGDFNAAYRYFNSFWSIEQQAGAEWIDTALGSEEKLGSLGAGAAGAGGDAAGGAAAAGGGLPIPIAGTDFRGLGAAGIGGEQRRFMDVFPGFVSSSPWAGIPNVGSAIAGAAPFFQSQFGMVNPLIPQTELPAGESRAGNWLRGLSTPGGTELLRGNPLAERLQAISAALQGPMTGTLGEGDMGTGDLLRGAFYDPKTSAPGTQVGAFENPFILATRGAPTSRALALQAIRKAATDFSYQYPSGIPVGESTMPEQFLPWALRTNLMGIQDLPEFKAMNWG